MVKVIPSKDPPEVFNKRLEEAVKRFYIAIQKEQTKKYAQMELNEDLDV